MEEGGGKLGPPTTFRDHVAGLSASTERDRGAVGGRHGAESCSELTLEALYETRQDHIKCMTE